jgi:FkbM family methyltransferase
MVAFSDHPLPAILNHCPRFSEPLGLLVKVLGRTRNHLNIIDVGANIGDSVVLINACAGVPCSFLCIEPDAEFAQLCRENTGRYENIQILEEFTGDGSSPIAGLVRHHGGSARPLIQADRDNSERPRRLDDMAAGFITENQTVDLIKVDTDGFDASILRSAAGLISCNRPSLFFELHPYFWELYGEKPEKTFADLLRWGYTHFLFFANRGHLYLEIEDPTNKELSTLANICKSRRGIDDFHFDILAAKPDVCREVAQESIQQTLSRGLI